MSNREFVLRSGGKGLFPTSDDGTEYIEGIGLNKDVMARLWMPRNMENHRHLWAILHEAAATIDGFSDPADLLERIKVINGMFTVHGVYQDKVAIRTKSTAFASMDEVSFRRIKARILETLAREWGFVESDLERAAIEQIASYGRGR